MKAITGKYANVHVESHLSLHLVSSTLLPLQKDVKAPMITPQRA